MAVTDRWYRKNRATGKREKTERYGSGKRWMAQWIDTAGKRVTRTFDTKDEADLEFATARADVYRGTYIDPKAGAITFEEFAEHWLDTAKHAALTSTQTRRRLEKHVYPHIGMMPLRRITPSVVRGWQKKIASTKNEQYRSTDRNTARVPYLSSSYQRLLFINVATVLRAAVADSIISKDPTKASTVTIPHKDTAKARAWSPERCAGVLEQLPDRWKMIHTLALGCGLRCGEAFGVDINQDVNRDTGMLTVQRQVIQLPDGPMIFKLPKYDKVREVPIPPEVMEAIDTYSEEFSSAEVTLPWGTIAGDPHTAHLLVTSQYGNPGAAKTFTPRIWSYACRRSGFEPTHRDGPHALRHTFASILIDAGESVVTVAEWLGHSDPAFTYRVYAHMMPDSDARTKNAVGAYFTKNGLT